MRLSRQIQHLIQVVVRQSTTAFFYFIYCLSHFSPNEKKYLKDSFIRLEDKYQKALAKLRGLFDLLNVRAERLNCRLDAVS